MIDVMDPTSYGTDTVYTDDHMQEVEERIDDSEGDQEANGLWKTNGGKKKPRLNTTTIFTDDVIWGDLGHGAPVLLQHGHHLDSLIWFKEKRAGKPIPLQLFDAGYDVWLGNNRGSYNCEL